MRVVYGFLCLTKKHYLSFSEKKKLVTIVNGYRYPVERRAEIIKTISGIVKHRSTYPRVEASVIKYLEASFTKKYQYARNYYLMHPIGVWQWLLETQNIHTGFTKTDLEKYDRQTGLIGNFYGVDCYVQPEMK